MIPDLIINKFKFYDTYYFAMDPVELPKLSISDLICYIATQNGSLLPVHNLWGFVRERLFTHNLEAGIMGVPESDIENGGDPDSFLYPLHAALCITEEQLRLPHEILMQLVDAFPPALSLETRSGFTPLHLAVTLGDASIVSFILDKYPDAVRSQSSVGRIPLHLATTPEIVNLLFDKDPTGMGATDKFGNTPLHLAACHTAYSPAVVESLLEKQPDYLFVFNLLNYSPLKGAIHNTVLKSTQEQDIDRVPTEFAIAWRKLKICLLAVANSRGCESGRFLHICMATLQEESLLKFAIEQYRDDVCKTDVCGRYPLHIAAMNQNMPGAIIRCLLREYPTAASICDTDSKLPLHYAAYSGRDFDDGLKDLVSANPLAVTVPGRQNNLFPFMMAAEGELTSIDSVFGLVQADPNVLQGCVFSLNPSNQ